MKQVRGRQVASTVRKRRRAAVGLLVALMLAGGAGWQLWGPDTASARSTTPGPSPTDVPVAVFRPPVATSQAPESATGLDAELARRFADAQAAAAADGVQLTITSGWRSAAEQQALVDEAITRYGSAASAHKWVLPPERSEHVKGLAIDVGATAGALWLGAHASEFGLCRTYANEMWHFEKRAEGGQACPTPHPNASWGW